MNANLNAKAEHHAAVPFAKAWGWSQEVWLAYDRDMDSQDDYERWMTEQEAEASDAAKQPADLNTSNAPF